MDWDKMAWTPNLDRVCGIIRLIQEYDYQHLAEHHQHCPVCVVDDDPPTGLSGTMEPAQQFVTCDDFEQFRSWLSQQRTAEWTRLMEHCHDNDGKVVFPGDEP